MLSTTVLLAASMIAGQAHGEKAIDPNLKPLTPLVGSWDVEFDWPDLPVEKAKVTYSWVLHGKYLEARWRAIDGEFLGSEYFAWDPTEKEIRLWGFDPWSFSNATWKISGNKWTGTYTSVSFDGTGSKNTITLEFKGSNKVHVTRTPKGSEQPDGTAVFVKSRGQGEQATPAVADNHYLKFWRKYFQGDWNTTLLEGEDRDGRIQAGAKGTWSCHPCNTRNCMLFTATVNGEPDFTTVAGYDPESKAWKEIAFMADGSHLTQFYFAEPGELDGDPVGKEIKGTAHFVYPDGRVEKAKIGVKIISRDKCKYYAVDRKIGDESQPDLELVFERK